MPGTPLQSSLVVMRPVLVQSWENGRDWTLESASTDAALAGNRPASRRADAAAESKRRLRRGADGDTEQPSQVAREMPKGRDHRRRGCHTRTGRNRTAPRLTPVRTALAA